MKTKKKGKAMTISTRDELEAAMNGYAVMHARLRGLGAELDVEIGKLRDRYAGRIAAVTEEIDPVAEAIEEWATLNPGEFAGKKSIDLLSGKVGWRTTPPSVKTLRGVREESAVERVSASPHSVA